MTDQIICARLGCPHPIDQTLARSRIRKYCSRHCYVTATRHLLVPSKRCVVCNKQFGPSVDMPPSKYAARRTCGAYACMRAAQIATSGHSPRQRQEPVATPTARDTTPRLAVSTPVYPDGYRYKDDIRAMQPTHTFTRGPAW